MNMHELLKRLRSERESGTLPKADPTESLDDRVESLLTDRVGPTPPLARVCDPQEVSDSSSAEKGDSQEHKSAPNVPKPVSSGLSIALDESAQQSKLPKTNSPVKAPSKEPPKKKEPRREVPVSRSAPTTPIAAATAAAAAESHEGGFASLIKSFNDFRHRTFAGSKEKKREHPGSRSSEPGFVAGFSRSKSDAASHHSADYETRSISSMASTSSVHSDGFMSGFTGATRVRQKSDSAALEKSRKAARRHSQKRGSAPAQVHSTPVIIGCMQSCVPSPPPAPAEKQPLLDDKKTPSYTDTKSPARRTSLASGSSTDSRSRPLAFDLRMRREAVAQAALASQTFSPPVPVVSPHALTTAAASH